MKTRVLLPIILVFLSVSLSAQTASNPGRTVMVGVDSAAVEPFVANVEDLLKGRLFGVDVYSPMAFPFLENVVYVEGTRLSINNAPAIILDGVRTDNLKMISPEDIATIEVFRGAEAVNLYGPAAAGGAVIIKTKGAELEGFHISLSTKTGIDWLSHNTEPMTLLDWSKLLPGADVEGRDRDYYSELMQPTTLLQQHHIALGYGSDKFRASASATLFDTDGHFKGKGDKYNRSSALLSLNYTPFPFWTIGASARLGGALTRKDPYNPSHTSLYSIVLHMEEDSRYPLFDLPGDLLKYNIDETREKEYSGMLWTELHPFDGFRMRALGSYTTASRKEIYL